MKLRMSVVGGAAGQRVQISGRSGCHNFPICVSVAATVRGGRGSVCFLRVFFSEENRSVSKLKTGVYALMQRAWHTVISTHMKIRVTHTHTQKTRMR